MAKKSKPKPPKIKPYDRVMQQLSNLPPVTRQGIANVVRAALARGLSVEDTVLEAQKVLRTAALKGLPTFTATEEFEMLREIVGDNATEEMAQKLAAVCIDFSRAEMDRLQAGMRKIAEAGVDAEDVPRHLDDLLTHIKFSRADGVASLYKPVKRESEEESSIEQYMRWMSSLHVMAKRETDQKRSEEATLIWTMLRDARIFHVGREVFGGLYQEADRYTTQEIAGQEFQPYDPTVVRPVPEEEKKHWIHSISRAAKHVAYPDKFPFDFVFLGYGEGVGLPSHSVAGKAPRIAGGTQVVGGTVLGHLMSANGYVVGFIEAETDDGQSFVFLDTVRTPDMGWPRSTDLEPWILPNIINIINDHRTFVIESPMHKTVRRAYKDAQRNLGLKNAPSGHMPPPYYTLKLQSQVIREKVRTSYPTGKKGPKSYRSDVRGHERCRIMRGDMPIDPKLAQKLIDRGYTLYTANQLDADAYRRLNERGLAYKRSDEWVAIKTTWVDDHQSPKNPNLPYVPAVRKFGNVKVRSKKPSGKWTDDPASV